MRTLSTAPGCTCGIDRREAAAAFPRDRRARVRGRTSSSSLTSGSLLIVVPVSDSRMTTASATSPFSINSRCSAGSLPVVRRISHNMLPIISTMAG
jgi:hypothetical protein